MSDVYEWKVYDPPMSVRVEVDEYNWDIRGTWEIPMSVWSRDLMALADMFRVMS